MMLTPAQIRAARALLGWSARILAEKAEVHITTIQRLERATGELHGNVTTLAKVQRALEAAGVDFLEAEGAQAGPGVRLSTRAPAE